MIRLGLERLISQAIWVAKLLRKGYKITYHKVVSSTGIFFSEALLFAEHGVCTKIVLNVRNNFCTQHVLPRVEHGIFMY